MSSTALKTLAVVMVIAAIILGFVAWRMSQGLTQAPGQAEKETPKPAEDQVLAVVATQRLPAYEPITEQQVSLVPISVEPPQYFTEMGEVVGRTPLQPVPVGFPVTQEAFGAANTLAQAIPAGTQAMSLEISDVIAVGGFVKPGDRVDVLVYFRQQGEEVTDSQARVLLRNARVLAYEERLINVSQDEDDDGRDQRRQRTAVLAVPVADTTRVMLGASLGELRLSLRGEETTPTETTTASGDDKPADGDKPEALASSANTKRAPDKAAGQKKDDEKKNQERVITLKELAEIKKEKDKDEQRQRPPIVPIDIYEGTEKKRVYRAYTR